MSVETPLNLISSSRNLYDVLWKCDESALTTDVCKSMDVVLSNIECYTAFDVVIESKEHMMLINDLSEQYEYTVGSGHTRGVYRTVKLIGNGLRFGDVYRWGTIYTPLNNLQICCYPLIIYGIR